MYSSMRAMLVKLDKMIVIVAIVISYKMRDTIGNTKTRRTKMDSLKTMMMRRRR